MAAITNRLIARNNHLKLRFGRGVVAVLEALVILVLAQRTGLWPLAMGVVIAVEWGTMRVSGAGRAVGRTQRLLERMPALLIGLGAVLTIAVTPRLITQAAVAGLFALWRIWWRSERVQEAAGLVNLLFMQIAVFEGLFLMAAIWRPSNWIVLVFAWLGAYLSVYSTLSRRGERAAGVMAAAWALLCVEVAWVLLLWLFTYTMNGGYVLVPQPALVLTAMGYCFGSIYVSQREGSLSRGRLVEYLLITLILIGIVVLGTSWRGSL